jgi:hypothetical protein
VTTSNPVASALTPFDTYEEWQRSGRGFTATTVLFSVSALANYCRASQLRSSGVATIQAEVRSARKPAAAPRPRLSRTPPAGLPARPGVRHASAAANTGDNRIFIVRRIGTEARSGLGIVLNGAGDWAALKLDLLRPCAWQRYRPRRDS